MKKKKNPPEFRDNNISDHCLVGKKKKIFRGGGEKANFVTPVEKKIEICCQLVKRTKAHREMQCYNYK